VEIQGREKGREEHEAVKIHIWGNVIEERQILGERDKIMHRFSPTNVSYPQILTSYPQKLQGGKRFKQEKFRSPRNLSRQGRIWKTNQFVMFYQQVARYCESSQAPFLL